MEQSYKYKPDWTKISLLILGLVVIVSGIFFTVKKYLDWKGQQYSYEALVQIYDQKSADPEEDAQANLKKGDVLVVFPKGHDWSDTEEKSYLILKMNISSEYADNLVKPDEEETGIETTEGKIVTTKKVIRMRAFRIKTEQLDFNVDEIWKGQPYARKVFDEKIIEEKTEVK